MRGVFLPALVLVAVFVSFGLPSATGQDDPNPLADGSDVDLNAIDSQRASSSGHVDAKTKTGTGRVQQHAIRPKDDADTESTDSTTVQGEDRNVRLLDSSIDDLSYFVSDRGAAAFDRTGPRFGRAFSSWRLPYQGGLVPPDGRMLAFRGSVSVSETAEKGAENPQSGASEKWKMNTLLSGTIEATLGRPSTGRFLELQYAAALRLGNDGENESDASGAVDQALTLTGHCDFAKLKLLMAADYSHSTGPDRDIGESTDRDSTSVRLISSYPLSMKTSLGLTLGETSSQYQAGINSNDLTAALTLNRQISQKTNIGIGGTAGLSTVEAQDDQTFQQVNIYVNYVPTLKLSFAGSVGYERRQVGNTNSSTPIFDGSVSFLVNPRTTFTLGATQSVSNSAAQAETNYTSTTIRASVSERFGDRVTTSLALGYQKASYNSVDGTDGASREDDYFFAFLATTFQVTSTFSMSLSYSYGDNRSNERAFQTQTVNLSGTYSF